MSALQFWDWQGGLQEVTRTGRKINMVKKRVKKGSSRGKKKEKKY